MTLEHEREHDECGRRGERPAGQIPEGGEERRVDEQVRLGVEVAPDRGDPSRGARELAVGVVEHRLHDEQERSEDQCPARQLDRGRHAYAEAREHHRGRRDAEGEQQQHDEVCQRPVDALADELGGRSPLPRAPVEARLGILRVVGAVEAWSEVDGALEREFRFESFPEAIAFVNRLAEAAEAANHHPDIAVSYRTVTVRWSTHSASAITDHDREMAGRTDELV